MSVGTFGGEYCQKCKTVRIVQIEYTHFEDRVVGAWTCHACGQWNWLEKLKDS